MTTKKRNNALRHILPVLGAALVLFAALPLLVVLGWTARLGILLLVPTGLLLAFHPRARRWLSSEFSEVASYRGLKIPTDVALHPAHVWVRRGQGRQVRVGADDLMQRALGPVDHVDLPAAGSLVTKGDPLFTLKRGNRSLTVLAPVTGEVLYNNEHLIKTPFLINDRPYHEGWVAEILAVGRENRSLKRGSRALRQFCGDIDQILEFGSQQGGHRLAQDGGELAEDLYLAFDNESWDAMSEQIFKQN